jgi:hypothetical protein
MKQNVCSILAKFSLQHNKQGQKMSHKTFWGMQLKRCRDSFNSLKTAMQHVTGLFLKAKVT